LKSSAENSKVQLKKKKFSWKIEMFSGKSRSSAGNEIVSRKIKSSAEVLDFPAENLKVQLKI